MYIKPSTEACSDLCIMDYGQVLKQFRLGGKGRGEGREGCTFCRCSQLYIILTYSMVQSPS